MSKDKISIQYPALFFMESDGLIYAFDDPIKYLDTSGLYHYENCIAVDSALRIHKIKSVNNDGWAFLWGYNPLKYGGRAVKISFNIENTSIMNLEELKLLILEFLSRETTPHRFWYNNESTEKMKWYVEKTDAQSFNDIYKLFNEDID
ncbi:MAG: hypothetical protein JNM22_17625 [Saprospiraceae bacterium]|nr:hypothetical protein [Saprospiraceae bacterium]